MHFYPRRPADDGRPDRAAESDAGYDPSDPGPSGGSPLDRLAERIDRLESAKRQVLDAFRDVDAWGGTAQTTGFTHEEWLQLCGRMAGRDSWKYQQLTRRLPALPVTAALLERGRLTFDQAVTIVAGTTRLSGDTLARVEAEAARAAVDRNRRGDAPDVDTDLEAIVQRHRKPADQHAAEQRKLDQSRVTIVPDLFGGGDIFEHQPDAEAFQTRVAALDHAAGPPAPGTSRGHQLAEGAVAMSRAWLAGRAAHPLTSGEDAAATGEGAGAADAVTGDDAAGAAITAPHAAALDGSMLADRFDAPPLPDTTAAVDLGPSSARPTILVRVDVRDLDGIDPDDPDSIRWLATGSDSAFGRVAAAGRLASSPWLSARMIDTLACNADLLVAIVDGQRPLAEFRRTRHIPAATRRQVLLRDLGCRWPGCKAPIAHCDIHHLDGDPTNHDPDNLVTLCRRHHRRLHSAFWHWRLDGRTGRFDLLRTANGQPVHTTWPRGTTPTPEVV